jgi:hypothetical protein
MAVVPKHSGHSKTYDPKDDLTLDQMRRFTKVANKAQHEKDESDVLSKSSYGDVDEILEESIDTKEEECVQQTIQYAKQHKRRKASKRYAYASLAISLLILSLAMMLLFS